MKVIGVGSIVLNVSDREASKRFYVDGAVDELRARGVAITDGPADQPWGERVAGLVDPDGYSINLTQPIAD